jgi:transcription termination factor Rho
MAGDFQIENAGVLRRQELVYRIIQAQARRNGHLVGRGRARARPGGIRLPARLEASYLPGPDDVFVSAQQIRRFGLMTGDAITGQARPPKPGERFFSLARIDTATASPRSAPRRKTFDHLTRSTPRGGFASR